MPTLWTGSALRDKLVRFFLKPNVTSTVIKKIRYMVHDFAIGQRFFTAIAVKDRDWNTPTALSADAPIGPVLNHIVDAFASPVRNPLDIIDVVERFLPQLVGFHGDEPLLSGTENNRFLASPTMRVTVGNGVLSKQRTNFLEFGRDLGVNCRDFLSAKKRKVVTVAAIIIYGVEDLQTIAQSGQVIIMTMPWSSMDTSSPRFQCHIVAKHQ